MSLESVRDEERGKARGEKERSISNELDERFFLRGQAELR